MTEMTTYKLVPVEPTDEMLAAAPASPAVGEEELARLVEAWSHGLRHRTTHESKMVDLARAILSRTSAQSDKRIRELEAALRQESDHAIRALKAGGGEIDDDPDKCAGGIMPPLRGECPKCGATEDEDCAFAPPTPGGE